MQEMTHIKQQKSWTVLCHNASTQEKDKFELLELHIDIGKVLLNSLTFTFRVKRGYFCCEGPLVTEMRHFLFEY